MFFLVSAWNGSESTMMPHVIRLSEYWGHFSTIIKRSTATNTLERLHMQEPSPVRSLLHQVEAAFVYYLPLKAEWQSDDWELKDRCMEVQTGRWPCYAPVLGFKDRRAFQYHSLCVIGQCCVMHQRISSFFSLHYIKSSIGYPLLWLAVETKCNKRANGGAGADLITLICPFLVTITVG